MISGTGCACCGFSKERRLDSQIIVGLLAVQVGFPLMVNASGEQPDAIGLPGRAVGSVSHPAGDFFRLAEHPAVAIVASAGHPRHGSLPL
jgi:hypothetical protein